ncbi:hypothetical protein QG37_06701 [Candidozyma auris]|nr:hypothetical protein QG37_06701 [[Candida] auris]
MKYQSSHTHDRHRFTTNQMQKILKKAKVVEKAEGIVWGKGKRGRAIKVCGLARRKKKKKCGVRSARGEEGEGSVNHQQKLHREKKRSRRGIEAKVYYTVFKGLPKNGKNLDPTRFFTFSSSLWTAFRRSRAFFYRQAPAPFFFPSPFRLQRGGRTKVSA